MAGSVNKVILVGNLGKDPEVRTTQGGQKIVTLSLATSESWTDKMTGERKERTEWHRVVIFNERVGDVAERYLKKGRKVYIEGTIQTRKWTDQSGQERYTTEIVIERFRGELVLIDSNRGEEGGGGGGYSRSESAPAYGGGLRQGASMGGGGTGGGSGGGGHGGQEGESSGWDTGGKAGPDLDDEIPF